MAWVLTKNLEKLRSEFNALNPDRDKASDGTIGDYAHSQGTSSHNPDDTSGSNPEWDGDSDSKQEVRALDIDNSGPWPSGVTFEKIIQMLVNKGRNGNLESVLRYMIYNERIWRASTGWATEVYTGPSPHHEHGHFTGAFSNAADENDSYNYGVAEMGDFLVGFIDNQTEFNNAMTAWASTAAGQNAIHMAWRSGKVQAYLDNGQPDGDNQIGIASAVTYAYKYPQTLANVVAGQIATRDAALSSSISAVASTLSSLASAEGTRYSDLVSQLNDVVAKLNQLPAAVVAALPAN